MNKSDLIRDVANRAGITLKDATDYFDAVIDAITENLKNGEKVQISGFGTFETKSKPAREGANPKTGEKTIFDGHIRIPKREIEGKSFYEKINALLGKLRAEILDRIRTETPN
ncbi:MAG: HU family DNA-binding protein, partial [Clostridia bacterium]|nr:HU family DNA-binding protein [Clostridia bacterium]